MTPGGSGGSVRGAAARASALVALVAATALACGPSGGTTPAGSPNGGSPAAVSAEPGSSPGLGPPAVSESPLVGDGAVEFAIADLVDRFGYDPDEVVVTSIEAVDWPDSALGCPAVDQEYEPGPVPGYRFTLQVDDMTYLYHGAAGDSEPFRCLFLD